MPGFGVVSPVPIQQFFDNNGNPLVGGQLFFYLAGTSTPATAYSDYGLTIPHPNPLTLDGAGRAPELFLDAYAYKMVLKTAAAVTLWTADNIVPPTALRSVGGQSTLTGLQHNVPVPQGLVTFLDFRNTALLTIDGFSGGTPGQVLLVRALGTARVDLIHASSSGSAVGNQLFNFVGSGPTSLVPVSGTALYVYQEGAWILITHEQGDWIAPDYSASRWTTNTTATWTIDTSDIVTLGYKLMGTSLLVTISVVATTIAGAPAPTRLGFAGLPYLAKLAALGVPATIVDNSGAAVPGFAGVDSGSNGVWFTRQNTVAWTPAANGTSVMVQLTIDVQ